MEQELYELPEGWEWFSLLKKSHIGINEKNLSVTDKNNLVPFISMSDIDQNTGLKTTYQLRNINEVKQGYVKFQKNALLVAKITPCAENNKTALITNCDFGYATTEVYPIHPFPDLNPKFFLYFFRSPTVRSILISQMEGATGRKRIPSKAIKNLFIPLPSYPEQQRIADKLDILLSRTDKAIMLLKENLETQDALFASLLQQAFDPLGRSGSKNENLYELPAGWEWKKLSEICTVVSGTTPKTSVSEYWDGQFNWVTPAELNDSTIIVFETKRKITEKAIHECSLKKMPKGTVLLSSRAPIGKVAITGQEMYCNQGFKNLICSHLVFNKFLFYFLKGQTNYLNSLGKGTTFKEISKKIVENIYLPHPVIFNEQQRIADKLDALAEKNEALKKTLQEKIDELNNLKSSILDAAFRGQL